MNDKELATLRELAEAVSDDDTGWTAGDISLAHYEPEYGVENAQGWVMAGADKDMAEFIAAASPKTVLALLDAIMALTNGLHDGTRAASWLAGRRFGHHEMLGDDDGAARRVIEAARIMDSDTANRGHAPVRTCHCKRCTLHYAIKELDLL